MKITFLCDKILQVLIWMIDRRNCMVLLSLGTEVIFQSVKFVIMLALIVVAWIIGSSIRKKVDANKTAKSEDNT